MTEILSGQRIVEVVLPDALLDCTAVDQGPSYPSVVEMADYTVSLGVPSHWRQAVVKPRDLTAAVTIGLWEAAGNNRGMTIKVFPDRDSAVEWLTRAPSGSDT